MGARERALERLLIAGGLAPASPPPSVRQADLPAEGRRSVLDALRMLGSTADVPRLAPRSWDMAFDGGLVVELDEEQHFNRYRAQVLDALQVDVPWRAAYSNLCVTHEIDCARVAGPARRGFWSNAGAEQLFGPSGSSLEDGGSARWKQRAVYDHMRDVAAVSGRVVLARISVHDVIDEVRVADVLDGRQEVAAPALRAFVDTRTVRV